VEIRRTHPHCTPFSLPFDVYFCIEGKPDTGEDEQISKQLKSLERIGNMGRWEDQWKEGAEQASKWIQTYQRICDPQGASKEDIKIWFNTVLTMAKETEKNKDKYNRAEKARRIKNKAVFDNWDPIAEIPESDHASASPEKFTTPAYIPFLRLETEEYLSTTFGENLRSHSLHQITTAAIEEW
jgi:hypothetical protein